jgi:hypothetical protein
MRKLNLTSVAPHQVPQGYRNSVRHESIFESEGHDVSKEAAERRLRQIRECHPESGGWVEIAAEVALNKNGKTWDVKRHHVQLHEAPIGAGMRE